MIPARIIKVEQMPLTSNGKIDRKALEEITEERGDREENYEAPRTEIEEILCGIWGEVLGRDRVGIRENFFELGGHSLVATQVVSRIRAVIGVDVPLRVMFEKPTVEGIAVAVQELVRGRSGKEAPDVVRVERNGRLPLSFAQQRLWFIDQLEPGNPAYNVPMAIRLSDLNVPALAAAVTEIVRRHEVLRTSFPAEEGEPEQRIGAAEEVEVPVVDLIGLREQIGEAAARRLAEEEAARCFDLSKGPLLRAMVVRKSDREHVLVVVMHHIVSDAWSAGVLIRELSVLYEAYREGRPSPLEELSIQYADYAVWQREWLKDEVLEEQLDYWRKQLEGMERLQLPFSSGGNSGRRSGEAAEFTIPAEVASEIRKLSREEGATLYMTLLAAFQALLFRYTGQKDILIGTPVSGRELAEIESLVGFFINLLTVRTRFSPETSFRQLIRIVRDVSLGAYAHSQIPFELVVSAVAGDRQGGEDALLHATFDFRAATAPEVETSLASGPFALSTLPVKRDLALVMSNAGDGIVGVLQYDAAKITEPDAVEFVQNLSRLLAVVAKDSDLPIIDIPLGGAEPQLSQSLGDPEFEMEFVF
jgi:hypothetical protein